MDELDGLRQLWERLDDGERAAETSAIRRRELAEESDRLHGAAREAYKLERLDVAQSLYRRARQAAERAGDERRQAGNLYWEGHCLRRLGRLREGLACLLMLEGLDRAEGGDYWSGLIDQVELAIQLPLALESIERLVDRCRDEMARLGLGASRGMLLLEECSLASRRGDHPKALAKAQEAMASFDQNVWPRYNIDSHYLDLISALLDVGDLDNARRWLGRYDGVETAREVEKELNLLELRARVELEEGDLSAAWRFAERQLQLARESQRSPYHELRDYCDAAIKSAHLREARAALAELLSVHRNDESGHRRYEIRRLVGDYHRAMATSYDARRIGHDTDSRRHVVLARRFYGYADKVGIFLDDKLRCDWRTKEIQERLSSLEDEALRNKPSRHRRQHGFIGFLSRKLKR